MAIPLTFGVEFEMSVADGVEWGEHTDSRFINFDTDPYGDGDGNEESADDVLKPDDANGHPDLDAKYSLPMPYVNVARHMAATLRAAGFQSTVDREDNGSWDFTSDFSIEAPLEDEGEEGAKVRYSYESIELRSPALYFTPESLQAVADVLKLLKRTYCINTNLTTGLHVHVGDGKKGWPLSVLRKFFAFSWAFENQLRTLFPPSRLDREYTGTMREDAWYSWDFLDKRGRRPTPMEGLVAVLQCSSSDDLQKMFRSGVFRTDPGPIDRHGGENQKPTIEWRHHQGTMDAQSVCIWIKTIVGTMEYLRSVRPSTFTDLLSIVGYERWEKLGDGRDDEREKEMGPVLAEGEFTIIDLLQAMGLYEPAEFYERRGLYRIMKDERCTGKFDPWLFRPRMASSHSKSERGSPNFLPLDDDELEIVGGGGTFSDDASESEDLAAKDAEVARLLAEGFDDDDY